MPATQIITASAFAALLLATPALAQNNAAARGTPARQSMEQCVQTVLTRLARTNAPETEVGPALRQTCDSQLRATLAAAIQAGQAGGCTVDTCIDIARDQASLEATQQYRARAR